MTLAGKRVVNTRAAHQASLLNDLLRQQGAIPLDYPAIAIAPPKDTTALDHALAAGEYELLVLTSANAVESVAQRARALNLVLTGVPAAAVGAATAQAAVAQLDVAISLIPSDYSAAALADALNFTPGTRILLPQSEIAPPTLAQALTARGAQVTALTAYRTVRGSGGVELAPLLRARQVDAVTFTSASCVRFFAERLRAESSAEPLILAVVCAACLSGQISRAARENGFSPVIEAETHTLAGLVAALSAHFAQLP